MLGEKIRNLRKENNLSQEELAERLGVSRQSISLWETDETQPALDKIVALADVFGVSTDTLLKENVDTYEKETPQQSESAEPKRKAKSGWVIALLILGSPVWLSLAIAAFAVAVSLYAVAWSVIISLWAVFGSLIGCGIGGVLSSIGLALAGKGISCLALCGAGVLCLGLSILFYYISLLASKGIVLLTKKLILGVRDLLIKEA